MSIRRAPRQCPASEGVNDTRLSWRARGILAYAMTHQEPMTIELATSLSGSGKRFGKESAASAINELIECGYLDGGKHYLKEKIPEHIRQQVLERDGYRCVECESIKRLSVDHIVPERRGGKAVRGNLQVLCRPCNSEKKDKMPGGDQ